jgi:hypothetical protein
MNILKIDTIIESFDHIKQAETPPFFETRLKAKMEKRFVEKDTAWFIVRKPAYIIASLIIFSSANLYLISVNSNKNDSSIYSKTQPSTIESFTRDYQLINNTTY